jgi:hypothetical protein
MDNRIRQKALKTYGCDLVCPHCKMWMHCHDERVPNCPGVYNYTCGNCGELSAWDFGLCPIPVLIDGGKIQLELNYGI